MNAVHIAAAANAICCPLFEFKSKNCSRAILDLSWWEPPLVKFIRPLVHVYGRLFSGLHGSFTSLVHSTMPGRAHLLCLTSKKSQKTSITTKKKQSLKTTKNPNQSLNPHQSIHSYYKQKKSLQILGWICKKNNRYLN